MRMLYLFVIVLSLGCSSSKRLTIKGTALHAKAGPIVVTPNEIGFYLDGVNEKKFTQYLDKKVTVKGRLVTIIDTFSNDKNNIATIRASIPVKLILKNPKIYMDYLKKWKKLN